MHKNNYKLTGDIVYKNVIWNNNIRRMENYRVVSVQFPKLSCCQFKTWDAKYNLHGNHKGNISVIYTQKKMKWELKLVHYKKKKYEENEGQSNYKTYRKQKSKW